MCVWGGTGGYRHCGFSATEKRPDIVEWMAGWDMDDEAHFSSGLTSRVSGMEQTARLGVGGGRVCRCIDAPGIIVWWSASSP